MKTNAINVDYIKKAVIVKIFIIIFFIILSAAIACYIYWMRNQEIRFSNIFPDVFEYYEVAGKNNKIIIDRDDIKYNTIKTWFDKNIDGWKNDNRNYVPNQVLKSKNLTINILKDGVVVNYTMDGESWSQVSKAKEENELVEIE